MSLVVATCVLVAVQAAHSQQSRPPALTQAELGVLSVSAGKGAEWLASRQDASGAFRPAARADACPVALTAMGLWALAETDAGTANRARAVEAIKFLRKYRQADGGIYDPDRGLRVYTSGVAAAALRACSERYEALGVENLLPELELFVYRREIPESIVDAAQTVDVGSSRTGSMARDLTQKKTELSSAELKAAEFLSRSSAGTLLERPSRARIPGWRRPDASLESFGYEDLLPLIYKPLRSDYPEAIRALRAIKSSYTLERNPDLTKRFGPDGFQPGTQGLFYYYHSLAKVLSLTDTPVVQMADGGSHNWTQELTRKLIALQNTKGYWVNSDARWWEDEPVLVTSYVLLALRMCRDVHELPQPAPSPH